MMSLGKYLLIIFSGHISYQFLSFLLENCFEVLVNDGHSEDVV